MPTETETNEMEQAKTEESQPKAMASKGTVVSFGEGRYSQAMRELFNDAQKLIGLPPGQAEKAARAFGAELGRHQATSKISFGKMTKDGKMTLRDTATLKGITVTYAVAIAKLCVILQETKQYGVQSIDVLLRDDFTEWLTKK